MMKRDKKNILILALTLVVVILLGALIYVFFVTPALNGLITKGYNQGQVDVVNAILTQVSSSGYVELPVNNNQSIILVPYQQPSQ